MTSPISRFSIRRSSSRTASCSTANCRAPSRSSSRPRAWCKKIDGTSRQLKEAIKAGARIIVTTIQKFSTDHLKEISGQGTRKFAVIIDEAHGSQSGKCAQAMTDALTREATSER